MRETNFWAHVFERIIGNTRQEVGSGGGQLPQLGDEMSALLRGQVPFLENIHSEGHDVQDRRMYQGSMENSSRQSRVLGSRQVVKGPPSSGEERSGKHDASTAHDARDCNGKPRYTGGRCCPPQLSLLWQGRRQIRHRAARGLWGPSVPMRRRKSAISRGC